MDVRAVLGGVALNYVVTTPARILFEREACHRPFLSSIIGSSGAAARRRISSLRGSSSPSFSAPLAVWGVLTGEGSDRASVTQGLLHVAHASLWTCSVPFIQNAITDSARDVLFVFYQLYAAARRVLDQDYQAYLYGEIARPLSIAAKTIAYAASYPFFLCAFGVRKNKPEHWQRIPASFLPSQKKPIPFAALPLFVLIAHLNDSMRDAGRARMNEFALRVRARHFPSTLYNGQSLLSERTEQLLRQIEELAFFVLAGALVVPLEVVLCTMLSSRSGLGSAIATVWREKGLSGFYGGFGWYLLSAYLPSTF